MKHFFLLLLTTLVFSCCSKDDNPFSGSDQLPPETQTGANTVGCLVNGKVYLPSQRGLNTPVNCYYQLDNGEFYFALRFADNKNYGPQVMVNTRKITLQSGNIYILNKNMVDDGDFIGGGGAFWNDPANILYTNTIKTGELKITRLDLQNSIISGTFWFDAENSAGETIEVRQGRFDWNY